MCGECERRRFHALTEFGATKLPLNVRLPDINTTLTSIYFLNIQIDFTILCR